MEILGELAERVDLSAGDGGELDESSLEQLGRLKTLRQIVTWIADQEQEGSAPAEPASENSAVRADESAPVAELATAELQTARHCWSLEPLAPADTGALADPLAGAEIALAGGSPALRAALGKRITARGGRVRMEPLRKQPVPIQPGRPEQGAEAGAAATLLHLEALEPAPEFAVVDLFREVREQVLAGAKRIRVATGLGGRLGLDLGDGPATALPEAALRSAGVRGLLKTFAREFPEVSFRVVDVDPREDSEKLADQLLAELDAVPGVPEVGYAGGVRRAPRLYAGPLDSGAAAGAPQLDASSVVLVLGGARGIAALASLELARAFGCKLELAGRSPLPDAEEPPELAAATGARELRQALLAQGRLRKPAEIEAECARLLAAREMRSTLRDLREIGVEVRYHALDVRDGAALGALIRDIYARHGRLDGVIHAAGVLEDRWIREKTPDSFARVFDTKVSAIRTLAAELRSDVQFVACFGSISGAFGNRGQVDYSAANDALATLGRALAAQVEGRVVTLAWGPWGGTGMVSAELASAYARRGIGLIEPADGVRALLEELRCGERAVCESVWMCGDPRGVMEFPAEPASGGVAERRRD